MSPCCLAECCAVTSRTPAEAVMAVGRVIDQLEEPKFNKQKIIHHVMLRGE